MNGAGGGNIIFGDGLENQPEKQIENNAFDILVANPPYSVSAFKSHLKLKNNTFELLSRISNEGSEIETLFVERIVQLLKPQGIAAVVLPSSILSNDSSSYVGAREILLKNFKLRAVVQLGSKTFGATDSQTVVLFLEKYNEPPKKWQLNQDSANAIINAAVTEDWEEQEILMAYLQKINVTIEDYKAFTQERTPLGSFKTCEYLKMYADEFSKLSRIVTLKNNKKFKELSPEEQTARLHQEFYAFVKAIETEKLLYFALIYQQTVLIVNAPTDNTKQKQFLGYYWTTRRGAEGIRITQAGGMLYNHHDHNAPDTIAAAIRQSFTAPSLEKTLGEKQKYCALAKLSDMIDFSRITFNKAIKLTPDKKIEIRSKYSLVKLEDVIAVIRGVTFDKSYQEQTETKNIVLTADNISLEGRFKIVKKVFVSDSIVFNKEKQLRKDDCFICFSSGSKQHVGKIAFITENQPYYAGGFMGILRVTKKTLLPKFLYEILNTKKMREIVRSQSHGTNIKNLSNKIGKIQIPFPPLDIQQQIITECEKIDEEYNTSRMSIDEYNEKIDQVFEGLEVVITKWGGGKAQIIRQL